MRQGGNAHILIAQKGDGTVPFSPLCRMRSWQAQDRDASGDLRLFVIYSPLFLVVPHCQGKHVAQWERQLLSGAILVVLLEQSEAVFLSVGFIACVCVREQPATHVFQEQFLFRSTLGTVPI